MAFMDGIKDAQRINVVFGMRGALAGKSGWSVALDTISAALLILMMMPFTYLDMLGL